MGDLAQLVIMLTGVIAVFLTQQPNEKFKKYACFFGLFAQPFWFYSAYTSGLWGIFIMCFAYTYCWCLGVYNNWLKKDL